VSKRVRDTVCLSVRVTKEQAAQLDAWVAARGITVQRVLERAVMVCCEWGPVDDERRAYTVTAEDARRGGAAHAPVAHAG
jgi:hypothetical protein